MPRFEIDFMLNFLADFAMCSVSRFINLRERIHDAVGVTRLPLRINLWVFEYKNFQEIIYLSLFVHNIRSKHDCETTHGEI